MGKPKKKTPLWIALLIFGAPLTMIGAVQYFPDASLQKNGIVTPALVLDKWLEQKGTVTSRGGPGSETVYHVSIQFQNMSGVIVNHDLTLSRNQWNGVIKGVNIDIVYDATRPDYIRLNSELPRVIGLELLLLGSGVLCLVTGGILKIKRPRM